MHDARHRPRRTLRRLWRRGRAIVRDEGWARLVFLVLADLGYRRFLILERRLDEPIVPVICRVPLVFEELRPAALEEYLRVHEQTPRARVDERLARGDTCVVARSHGRIVAVSWISRDPHFFRSLGCRYAMSPSDVYLYDSFTDPRERGRAVAPALGVYVLEGLRQAGLTRAILAIAPENAANRRARAKTGFRPFMRIDYLRVGSRSWHRHRATDVGGRTQRR